MSRPRWFEVMTRGTTGAQFAVLASDQTEADAAGRAIAADDFFLAHDACGLPDGVEVLYQGYCRSRREREWLLRYDGVQVHVYEQIDTMFLHHRFRANIPGYGTCGWTLWQACCAAGSRNDSVDPDWFTKEVAAGKAYYPTSYKLSSERAA